MKLFALHANAKSSHRNNTQYPLCYVSKVPRKFLSCASRKTKMPNNTFFSGTSQSGDSHGGTFTTSNISFHLTET